MKLLIFGGSGKVGQLVLGEALRRGHSVIAFVHTSPLKQRRNLQQIKGDIRDRASIVAAFELQPDAVICTLSSWHAAEKNVLSTAMQRIIPAAKAVDVTRLVTLTGNVAAAPGGKMHISTRAGKLLLGIAAPKVLRDAEDHIALLAQSGLNWTVVRSPVMNNTYETHYQLNTHSAGPTVSRQAVAEALVDLAENGQWPRSAPFIHRA